MAKTINNKSLDKRVKLTDAQREEIKLFKGKMTQSAVAKMYGVNRRTISFIWFPEQLEENKKKESRKRWKRAILQ